MPVPDYQSLMLPVLMASTTGEIRIADAVDRLAKQLNLSSDERAQLLPSGKQTLFGNRVHWAKTYLPRRVCWKALGGGISKSQSAANR